LWRSTAYLSRAPGFTLFLVGSLFIHLFSFLCCFVCLCHLSCVSNVTSVNSWAPLRFSLTFIMFIHKQFNIPTHPYTSGIIPLNHCLNETWNCDWCHQWFQHGFKYICFPGYIRVVLCFNILLCFCLAFYCCVITANI